MHRNSDLIGYKGREKAGVKGVSMGERRKVLREVREKE